MTSSIVKMELITIRANIEIIMLMLDTKIYHYYKQIKLPYVSLLHKTLDSYF